MQPIFRDDSSDRDQRDTAIDRLLLLCPAAFRLAFRDQVVKAVDAVPLAELQRMMANIDELERIAATGDVDALTTAATATARSFGVDESQMTMVRNMAAMFVTVPQS